MGFEPPQAHNRMAHSDRKTTQQIYVRQPRRARASRKLKCVLQERHILDVYDLVYAAFINRDIVVDRNEVITAFLRKTIYQPSPGVARQLLLKLPLHALKIAWYR
jgi:hypothetical protein